MRPILSRIPLIVALVLAANVWPARAADHVDFNRDIRPLFSNTCFKCHGPDAAQRKGGSGGLRLDTPEGAIEDLGGYAAIVPGRPDESELLRRLATDDEAERMPPAKVGPKLPPEKIELVKRWIEQGATYSRHWSYIKPVRSPLPDVGRREWPRNEIDHFILARLEREGMSPAPEAERPTLLRRLALDLTGLPPTLAEVDQFLADRAEGAYERAVDRLLAKESYGENFARLWLDLARYADSSGYADDPPRTIWAYRDYVIRSLNANKPFDQFTIEQLAGDLLPNPTEEQLVATAFHRNTLTNNEGGTNDEEFRNVAIVDRVNTTMAVWMGTTIHCCQCHNHKYDPLSQEEYFRLFAILNNTEDADRGDDSPRLPLQPDTSVPILRELTKDRRKTFLQQRGNYLDLGPEVTPGVPAAFHPLKLPDGQTPDRLALAQWLVDAENPLTARVIVNRLWEKMFGIGIVRTSEEFGSQGDLPSHPELLDWLAVELGERGWDLKQMLRLLVTSAAYRQSSRVSGEAVERDPENRLLGRGPRFRLSAEAIRDQALAVGGLLSPKMYGPPVRPPQPQFGVKAAFGGGIDWTTSEGEDKFRRGIYVTWRRSNPYPSMSAFDAPNREVCTLRRDRTNTPLQALVTLNDPVYLEASQALARRMIAEGGASVGGRASYGFRLCVARLPKDAELSPLIALYQAALERYAGDEARARQMATQPLGPAPEGTNLAELAAWTVVGNVLLNLDEMFMP